MMVPDRFRSRLRHAIVSPMALTAALLVAGLAPMPGGRVRSALQSVRSPELNRADREANAGGYYEGLMDGGGGGRDGARGEVPLRLLGKPTDWVRFHEAGVSRYLPGDFLQFELLPNLNRPLFGRPFTTNAFGMRDRPHILQKPEGTYRIALVGSSMDMGWGVGTEETYAYHLEDWLNVHAAKRGLPRRFEVLNFAVAAYSPAQRLDSYRRKAVPFDPDMVIYSATMLDPRLTEIHLCGLLQGKTDLRYDFLRGAIADAGLTPGDLRVASGQLLSKDLVKKKLKPRLWAIGDGALGVLADDCRSAGRPLICLVVPRVGKADAPDARAESVARHREIGAHHAVPVIDLSATFDEEEPASIEIAAWDDHPNALGHKLLFRALARALVADATLYRTLFHADPIPIDPDHPIADVGAARRTR